MATLTQEVAGSNPGKSHWLATGRASGPKMLTAPAKSQLTIGHHPNVKIWWMSVKYLEIYNRCHGDQGSNCLASAYAKSSLCT